MLLEEKVRILYNEFGQRKHMAKGSQDVKKPHFFLHRTFMGEQDLLIILNTKRCRYRCYFCSLPTKCSNDWISGDDIVAQFEYVINELKHSLSIFDRVTISNEGSMLDSETMPTEALIKIARSINELRRVRKIVLETRLNFVDTKVIQDVAGVTKRAKLEFLTGFETLDSTIRDEILGKQEKLEHFEEGLDKIAKIGANLTTFILFKPSQNMNDSEALLEANNSINYILNQCEKRGIDVTIRLNPMYAAKDSKWAQIALNTPEYQPPRLSDIINLATQEAKNGVKIYVGLSTEGIDESWGSYITRDDFSSKMIKQVILLNNLNKHQ